jgi:hypothetical protein
VRPSPASDRLLGAGITIAGLIFNQPDLHHAAALAHLAHAVPLESVGQLGQEQLVAALHPGLTAKGFAALGDGLLVGAGFRVLRVDAPAQVGRGQPPGVLPAEPARQALGEVFVQLAQQLPGVAGAGGLHFGRGRRRSHRRSSVVRLTD